MWKHEVKVKCAEIPYKHEGRQAIAMDIDRLCKCSGACNAAGTKEILPTGRNVERCPHDGTQRLTNFIVIT